MPNIDLKTQALTKFIFLARDENELSPLLSEILTETEIHKIHERIQILTCLTQGCSQRKTVEKTGAAIATVSRGARLIQKTPFIFPTFLSRAINLPWWRKLFGEA